MKDIRLVGLAKPSKGTNEEILHQLTGFRLRLDGNDWIIPSTDPALQRGPLDILKTSDQPWDLDPKSYAEIADQFASSYLVLSFEEKLTQPTEKIKVYGEWGIRTSLEIQGLNFFLTPAREVSIRLVNETFPFFYNDLNARSVAPISTNAEYQQAVLSLSRILALVEFSGSDKAIENVNNNSKRLNAALPTPLDIMTYVECLNTMSPSAISLPMHRMGSALHFMRPKPWFFPRLAIENIYEQLLSKIEPLAAKEIAFFTKDQHFQKRAVHCYFVTAVESVNRMARYLNDLRSYVRNDGVFDATKLVKAHAVVRLMFADWQSINFTNSRYIKIRMVFAFLDKLANLVSTLKGGTVGEEDLFRRFCSEATGQKLAQLVKGNFEKRFHGLGRLMAGVTTAAYRSIHSHIAQELQKSSTTEYERLAYLRKLRNSAHGAFLKSEQFEEVFLGAGGTMCAEFYYLPLLLLWGLVSDPAVFIEQL